METKRITVPELGRMKAAGERVLFPAVRGAPDDLVVAPGFSCRSQIKDFCDGRRAIHPAELLAMAEV